jgi:gliding motility-associated-like protein
VLADANEAGLKTSISNQVVVTKNANLFYPNAFTPDDIGPKANETFTVYGQYIQKMELKIFDRWGTLVYFSDNNTPWDGTNNGRDMPEGTYVWIASLTDFAGQQFSREGTVVILRKKKK